MLTNKMMSEFELVLEDREIIKYTNLVLSLDEINSDMTIPMLMTKSFGLVTPDTIKMWIKVGCLKVIPNVDTSKKAA